MCTYSMIADHANSIWQQRYPSVYMNPPEVNRFEFDALKREVEDLKGLLIKAKEYDARNSEPDCEMAYKVAILKKVADLVGIDISAALPEAK